MSLGESMQSRDACEVGSDWNGCREMPICRKGSMSCWGVGYMRDPFVQIHPRERLKSVHSLLVNLISIKSKMKKCMVRKG